VKTFGSNNVPLFSSSLRKKFLPLTFIAACRQCVALSTVKHWVQQFKEEVEEASLCDMARSQRSMTQTGKSHQESTEEMVSENRLIKQKGTALKLGISEERVGHIINLLGFQNIFARWVP
jgi:hypothetical protein